MKTIGRLGENAFVAALRRRLPATASVITGIGDDCAVVRVAPGCANDLLLTSDPVIEGIHFAPDARPEQIGHKAVGRVLSDLAAMGAKPLWILIDLVAPPRTPVARLDGICRGAQRLARRFGAAIVGGDTSRGRTLELHAFAVGRVPRGTAALRSGARPGDAIYVTGTLGGSGAGRHLAFTPRLAEGAWLRAGGWITAMMDLSDGLAADLPRLLAASGAGAELRADRLPVSPAARRPALDHALGDGEDFELLFTVPARKAAAFEAAWRKRFRLRCTRIGGVTRRTKGGLVLIGADGVKRMLRVRGYEHFRR
jgi:thiamine-monophosphate kinase